MCGACDSGQRQPTTTTLCITDQFLVEKDLHHGLNGITYVHQLKELQQRGDARRFLMFLRFIRGHLLGCSSGRSTMFNGLIETNNAQSESNAYVSATQCLQHQNEQLLDSISHAMTVVAGIPRKRLNTLESLVVSVNELECDVE